MFNSNLQNMKLYRYNSKKREDRKFNTCGREKNPNSLRFFATSMEYADKYRFVYDDGGFAIYECDLEVTEMGNENLFNMAEGFKTLSTYKSYIQDQISAQMKDYTTFLNNAKTKSAKKIWEKNIADLSNRENELVVSLTTNEFQMLSDFEYQNQLVAELKGLGFSGYQTKKEIALF
jgi:hypothetical protein